MATTAAVTLTSDLLSDALSVSTTTTCMKAGTTADGLDQMRMGRNEVPTGTSFDLLDATTAGIDKANKVYIANLSTDETYYVIVVIDAKVIGRLYGGDWMFIPWNMDDATHDLEVTAYVGTNTIEWVKFHENETLATQGD
jgi:disulfide oxidoreductase YuzD